MLINKVLLIALITVVAGCSSTNIEGQESKNQNGSSNLNSMGEMVEVTSGPEELPGFLESKPDSIKKVYAAVASNQEILEKIPCYCGCGDSVDHKNNYDCFIQDNKENGAIEWNTHGMNCGVCLEIASQSIVDYQNGKSIKEIRKEIDNKYKDGYAKPTPTPEV